MFNEYNFWGANGYLKAFMRDFKYLVVYLTNEK